MERAVYLAGRASTVIARPALSQRIVDRDHLVRSVPVIGEISGIHFRKRYRPREVGALTGPVAFPIGEEEQLVFLYGPAAGDAILVLLERQLSGLFAFAKKPLAFSTVLRKYSYALPWNSLLPDFEDMLTTPPP